MMQTRPTVLCLGTLDTKGPETAALAEGIRRRGCDTIVLDCGILGSPVGVVPDITRDQVASAAGTDIESLRTIGSRGTAIEHMLKGVRAMALELHASGRIHGVVALGGAEGSALAAAAMTELPVGFPKLIVSPLASGRRLFEPFVGTRDVTVMHSVVDILGLNSIGSVVYDNASAAMAGMALAFHAREPMAPARTQVAATMLGNTTLPLMWIREQMLESDQELVIFHANGVGGAAMEESMDSGQFTGVIDFTLNELAAEVAGGFHACCKCQRLSQAGRLGLPQIVVPGCVDFTVHGPRDELPADKRDCPSYYHSPTFTLVRLDHDEQCEVARRMASRLNESCGPVKVMIPMGGFSIPDAPGGEFWNPVITEAFCKELEEALHDNVKVEHIEAHINDQAFAEAVLAAWRSC
ncbi:MAG: Tm-1-like ATP-binding domain-containing protein [Phycisphaerales bacterium]|nr:Tm-1-like ATP-binding domain-containing protein [Phycisphaerales bacterium]